METETKTETALAKSLSFDKLGFIYPDIDPNSPQMDQVCQFFNDAGRDFKNGKVYGEEMVKRYNMHEELLSALKECSRFNKAVMKVDGSILGGEDEFYEHYKKIEQLLKQAEQK